MATLSPPRSTNGVRAPRRAGARVAQVGRRRQLSVAIVGAFLVVGGALAFADASLHLGSRQDVLVTTRALTVGEVLDTSDLTTAALSSNSGLPFVAANEESSIVGRPLAVPLVAGVPITTGEVGSPASVVAGSDVVAVLLKPGGFPPSLSPGDRVEVVPVAPTGSVAPSTNPLPATVLSVSADPSDADGSSVIGLQVQSSVAATVAQLAAAGEASLVQLGTSS
jgi:Flp pilus assembly protein CpaB